MKILKKIIEEMQDTSWQPIDVVEVELTAHHNCFYPNHKFYKVKGDEEEIYYMKQEGDVLDHVMVYQRTGYSEDDYYGFQLLPLGKGKYLKVSYSC